MIIDMNCPLGRNASYLLEKANKVDITAVQKFKHFTKAIECVSYATDGEVDSEDIMTSMYLFLLTQADKV